MPPIWHIIGILRWFKKGIRRATAGTFAATRDEIARTLESSAGGLQTMAEKRSPSSEKAQAVFAPPVRKSGTSADNGKGPKPLRLGKDCDYEQELRRLQIEL